MAKSNNTSTKVLTRQAKQKAALVEQLHKIPIVQMACEKVGIARATYYRWLKDDEVFEKNVDEALSESIEIVNDMAESQIIRLMKDGSLPASTFWLRHRHKAYKARVEVNGKVEIQSAKLTPEQEKTVRKALEMAHLVESEQQED